MAIQKVDIKDFLALAKLHPVFDVRSPEEYNYAHIPGAFSLPIFSNDERKEIGTAYKRISREKAIDIGLKYFGVKLNEYVKQVKSILSNHHNQSNKVLVHCWRGGMRSAAMAWLLSFYGFEVVLLDGGYKSYRKMVLQHFELPFTFYVIGGYTGSGKTEVLTEFIYDKIPAINLEHLASHKGSSFGALGMNAQPTQEAFENYLFEALSQFYTVDDAGKLNQPKPIWIENESQRIGLVNLPKSLYHVMQDSKIFFVDIPFDERLKHIVKNYGIFATEKLVESVMRIQKRLGGLDTKNTIQALQENNLEAAFHILLSYYDRQYKKFGDHENRNQILVEWPAIQPKEIASHLLKITDEYDTKN